MPPFDNTWKNTKMETTHKKEFAMACILNSQLCNYDMRVRRVPGDPYSLYDLEVMEYNYTELKNGKILCRIDLESKKDKFPKGGVPARWKRGVSFLVRKSQKEINYDRDVYLLFDPRLEETSYPRVIWASYKIIRDFGVYNCYDGEKNEFKEIKKEHYKHLNFTIRSLIKWCDQIRNNELIGVI